MRMTAVLYAVLASGAAWADTTAILAGRVHTGTGEVLERATIWVEGGRIVRIDQARPGPGVRVIDHADATVIPGFVAATSQLGGDDSANEESSEITPDFRVSASIGTSPVYLERAIARGITTAFVRPGLANVIAGQGAVIRPGAPPESLVLADGLELVIPIGPWPAMGNTSPSWGGIQTTRARRPTTRMGTVWLVRKSFFDARTYQLTKRTDGLSKEAPGSYTARELEVLVEVLEGKRIARFVARADKDVRTALRIAAEFGIPRVRIEGLAEGYRGPDELATVSEGLICEVVASDPINANQPLSGLPLPVAVFDHWLCGTHDPLCGCCDLLLSSAGAPGSAELALEGHVRPEYGPRADNVAVLARRTKKLALTTVNHTNHVPEPLEAGSYAIRHGADEQEVLAMLTRIPADMLGLAAEVGTIAPGRRADLVVMSGDPFEVTSRILAVYADGALRHNSAETTR